MNRWNTLYFALFVSIMPTSVRAVDLATVDRSIMKEPLYQTKSPGYCLLVFGKEARTRVWIVVDGQRLYIDRNGNGDLTEPDEMVPSSTSTAGSSQSFQVDQIQEVDGTVHHNLKFWVSDDDELRCTIALARRCRQYVGYGSQHPRPKLASQPQDAPVVHLNGSMTFARLGPIVFYPTGLENTPVPKTLLRLMIGSPGLGEGTFAAYQLKVLQVGGGYQDVTAEIEFPNSDANASPFTLREQLKVRGAEAYMTFHSVPVPQNAGPGFVNWTFSIPEWKEEKITPQTSRMMLIAGPEDLPKIVPLLHDGEAAARTAAIRAVTTFDRAAVPQIIENLKAEPKNGDVVSELALAALRAKGAMLRYQSNKLTNVAIVQRPDVTNDDLKLLRYLPGTDPAHDLADLNLYGAQITDDGLEHIKDLTKLSSLVLSQTKITDEGLRHLQGLNELTFLNLQGTGVTDQGLTDIAHLPKLSFIVLDGNAITDAGLKTIANPRMFPSLIAVGLSNTQITDDGLVYLAKRKHLERLYIGHSRITSKGVAHLTDMLQLQALSLSASLVDVATIDLLAELKTLGKLELQGRIPDELKVKLREKLPDCEIKYWRN